jgi:ribonuclease Z
VNAVVYQENGVTIRSVPAIHAGDGPVSFILEYAGLRVVIGGDTFPNKWYIEHAANADLAIHETFLTPPDLVRLYGQSPGQAIAVGTQIHTSPQAFGKVMSTIKPRHAVGYHFFNEQATHDDILRGVLQTYTGPLSLAVDNMVWNITKEGGQRTQQAAEAAGQGQRARSDLRLHQGRPLATGRTSAGCDGRGIQEGESSPIARRP